MRTVLLLLALVCALPAQEPKVNIAGTWSSVTGSIIEIPAYGAKNEFTLIVKTREDKVVFRARGRWLPGQGQRFSYRTPQGETIYGVVASDGEEVQLHNAGRDWTSRWIPGTRH